MPRYIERGTRIPFRLSRRERDLMLKRCFLDSDMDSRLREAERAGGAVVVGVTLQDIDDLAGHVAAEANHSDDAHDIERISKRCRTPSWPGNSIGCSGVVSNATPIGLAISSFRGDARNVRMYSS